MWSDANKCIFNASCLTLRGTPSKIRNPPGISGVGALLCLHGTRSPGYCVHRVTKSDPVAWWTQTQVWTPDVDFGEWAKIYGSIIFCSEKVKRFNCYTFVVYRCVRCCITLFCLIISSTSCKVCLCAACM